MTTIILLALGLLTIAAWAAADVWLYAKGGYPATFSAALLNAARSRPIVAALVGLAVGILLGHLFWPQP